MANHTDRKATESVRRPREGVDEWGPPDSVGQGGEKHDFSTGPLVGTLVSADMISTQYGDRLIISVKTADGLCDHFMSESWAAKYAGRIGQRLRLASNGAEGTKVRYTLQWAAGSKPGAGTVGRKASGPNQDADDVPESW